jgi:hypothetical protein
LNIHYKIGNENVMVFIAAINVVVIISFPRTLLQEIVKGTSLLSAKIVVVRCYRPKLLVVPIIFRLKGDVFCILSRHRKCCCCDYAPLPSQQQKITKSIPTASPPLLGFRY